jgi:hypothetical protein
MPPCGVFSEDKLPITLLIPKIGRKVFDEIVRGEKFVFIYGVIEYDDGFKNIFELGYAIKISAPLDARGLPDISFTFPETPGYNFLRRKKI